MSSLGDLPEELQGCCTRALDTSSAGCFGRVNKACQQLVEVRLAAEKAAHEARYDEFYDKFSLRCGEALASVCRIPDGPKLLTFPVGGPKLFTCTCVCTASAFSSSPCRVGLSFRAVARHLASRQHWKHWRLVAFGEAQPTEAAWLAFRATVPAAVAPM